eukprot:3739072-Pyramimonas_sp.AAC.1
MALGAHGIASLFQQRRVHQVPPTSRQTSRLASSALEGWPPGWRSSCTEGHAQSTSSKHFANSVF